MEIENRINKIYENNPLGLGKKENAPIIIELVNVLKKNQELTVSDAVSILNNTINILPLITKID